MALEDLYDVLIAHSVNVLRRHSVTPRLVNRDIAATLEKMGSVVNVSVAQPKTTAPVVPGPVPPGGARPVPRTVPVTLNHWEDSSFSLTDRDISSMSTNAAYLPQELQSSANAVADRIDSTLLANYTGVYGFAGTPGTTPFGTSLLEAQQVIQQFADQEAPPMDMRHLLLDTFAYSNALGLQALQDASRFGDDSVIKEGRINYALGFGWHLNQGVPYHTTGAAGTPLIDAPTYFPGTTVIHVDGLIVRPNVGDVFSIAGSTQTYTVLAATPLVGTDSDLTISPPLETVVSENVALTFRPSHRVNLAFHPSAFAFASRVATGIQLADRGPVVRSFLDEVSGVVLTLRINPEHYQTSFYLSCMWGSRLIDPRLAVRLAG